MTGTEKNIPTELQRTAIIGSGTWATAIAKILNENAVEFSWWIREDKIAKSLQQRGRNPLYLSSVRLSMNTIHVSNDLNEVIENSDNIILVLPSAYISSTFKTIEPQKLKGKKVIIASKGIVAETQQLISDYFKSRFALTDKDIAVICGASHAEEIAQGRITFLTIATEEESFARKIKELFNSPYVKLTTNQDMIGLEYAVTLKNIYALGAGIYIGLGNGDNLIATYMANCIREMRYFFEQIHPETLPHLAESSYIGDLLVTAYSQHSRNRTFGHLIGKGVSISVAHLELKMVAEGYYACACIQKLIDEKGIVMPIVESVYKVLYQDYNVTETMQALLETFR